MTREGSVEEFFEARKRAKLQVVDEKKHVMEDGKPWNLYDWDVARYSDELAGLLNGGSLETVCRNEKDEHGRAHLLHVMGGTRVLEELILKRAVSGGVAVTLSEYRKPTKKILDRALGLGDLITGDVLNGNTWRMVDKYRETKDIKGFDVVICCPAGGWNVIGQNLELKWLLLDKVWQQLNETATLFLELPGWNNEQFKFWENFFLNRNIDVSVGKHGYLRYDRRHEDPKRLSRLTKEELKAYPVTPH